MIAHEIDIDFINQTTPPDECQMFCAVLYTFVEDIKQIKKLTTKYKDTDIPDRIKYNGNYHPYIDLYSLLNEINSEWTETLCDLAGVNYVALREGLFKIIERDLGRSIN